MTLELNKEYKINQLKPMILRISAIVLLVGALVSVPTSIMMRSVMPFLGGIYLAFAAYYLLVVASQRMWINSEGIVLKNRLGEHLLPWLDFGEISQGKGINRHKVSYTLMSNPPSPGINLGICRFQLSEGYHLPSTFGMKAEKLAADLERTRKETIQHGA